MKKTGRKGRRDGIKKKKQRRGREWKTARYRPLPGPLSIATPSEPRLRHAICATVGSWNFATPKIVTPARGRLPKEGRREQRNATLRYAAAVAVAATTAVAAFPLASSSSKRIQEQPAAAAWPPTLLRPSSFAREWLAGHRRQPSVNRAHTHGQLPYVTCTYTGCLRGYACFLNS